MLSKRNSRGKRSIYYITIHKNITIYNTASNNSQINRNIGTYANEGGQNVRKGKNIQKR